MGNKSARSGTRDGRAVGPGDDGMCVGNCVGDSVGGVGAGDDGAFVTTVTLVMTVLVTTTTLTTVPFGSVYCCVWLTTACKKTGYSTRRVQSEQGAASEKGGGREGAASEKGGGSRAERDLRC